MSRFRITIDDRPPVVTGPRGEEAFSISLHDGSPIEDPSKNNELPKIIAMTYENPGSAGPTLKYWLDEKISVGTGIHIEVLGDGNVDSPARIEQQESPIEMCWYCFKNADEVEYLVAAPQGTMHICNNCVDICSVEIEKRRGRPR